MNNDNLISLKNRTLEERREIAKKGGLAKAKREIERNTLKADLKIQEMIDFDTSNKYGIEEQEEAFNYSHIACRVVELMNDDNPKVKIEAIRLYSELMGLDKESQIKREEIEAKKEIAMKELEIKRLELEIKYTNAEIEKEKIKSKNREKIVSDN